jgi:hypothetical protein
MIAKRERFSALTRDKLLAIQFNKCANTPTIKAIECHNYDCVRWQFFEGNFERNHYEIDHKIEFSKGGTNEIDNLQELCLDCHKYKTLNFVKSKYLFDSVEIDAGVCQMEDIKPKKKKYTRKQDVKEMMD